MFHVATFYSQTFTEISVIEIKGNFQLLATVKKSGMTAENRTIQAQIR